jgi:acetate kinase
VKSEIAGVSAFAALHNRAELEGIEAMEKLSGNVPQVAVFDTGFHRRIPPAAAVYPGPYEWFTLDTLANRHTVPDADIAMPDSSVRVLVIRTQEEWAIARECWRIAQIGFT